jgi:ADP-dependent NAD(P)H-hydrate dehydratase / NAD(P)H-hydrate epimerase
MDHPYWQRQTTEKPLFPDLLWSRPENKQFAGKLLVVGGNLHGFSAPATAYNAALQAGVGVARVMLPDKLEKTVHRIFPEAEYAPSTPSGSFATKALGELLPAAEWADGVLLAGDIGKNSETTILFDSFLEKYPGNITLCGDMIDYASLQAKTIITRPRTLLVCTDYELQKFAVRSEYPIAITSNMDMIQLVNALHSMSLEWAVNLLVLRDNTAFVAVDGLVSSTPTSIGINELAAHASVWLLQNPTKPYEALTCAVTRTFERI